jgi:hypothetical protein
VVNVIVRLRDRNGYQPVAKACRRMECIARAEGNAPISNQVFQFGTVWVLNGCKKQSFSGKNGVKSDKKQSFLGEIWLKNTVFGAKMGIKTG